jgi:hypothetical protein
MTYPRRSSSVIENHCRHCRALFLGSSRLACLARSVPRISCRFQISFIKLGRRCDRHRFGGRSICLTLRHLPIDLCRLLHLSSGDAFDPLSFVLGSAIRDAESLFSGINGRPVVHLCECFVFRTLRDSHAVLVTRLFVTLHPVYLFVCNRTQSTIAATRWRRSSVAYWPLPIRCTDARRPELSLMKIFVVGKRQPPVFELCICPR